MLDKQVSYDRIVPMWGGICEKGAAVLCFHDNRKITSAEWVAAVRKGAIVTQLRQLWPAHRGMWRLLCDNESFLRSKESRPANAAAGLDLVGVPPRSPDLNPVERYWAWLRKHLRKLDLADLVAKRKPLTPVQYRARVRSVIKSAKSKQVARNCMRGLRKVCSEVVRNGGRASKG